MRRLFCLLAVVLCLASTNSLWAQGAPPAKVATEDKKHPIAGIWEGSLTAGAFKLRMSFHLVTKADGSLSGTVDVIDQGAKDIPLSKVTLEEGTLKIDMAAMRASFEGKLSADKQTVEGHFKQLQANLPLNLKKVEKATTLNRPQTPKGPFPYNSEDVEYTNAKTKNTLAGTLTLPKGDGPFPVVLLISGSGAQDRDETIFEHKPFFVIADHLTRSGIAVLRVDDRGYGKSKGDFATATTLDFADDADAGVAYLKTRKEIDPKRIGLCGHSEGGVVAPIVAARNSDVNFIILLAGTGITGKEILHLQSRAAAVAAGASKEQAEKSGKFTDAMVEVLLAEKDPAKLDKAVDKKLDEYIANLNDSEKKELEQAGGRPALVRQTKVMINPWMRTFIELDPRVALRKVTCSVLAINGEKDVQVDCEANLTEIEKALKESGNSKFKTKKYAGLNHLFQKSPTGTGNVREYSEIETTMEAEVLKDLVEWIGSLKK